VNDKHPPDTHLLSLFYEILQYNCLAPVKSFGLRIVNVWDSYYSNCVLEASLIFSEVNNIFIQERLYIKISKEASHKLFLKLALKLLSWNQQITNSRRQRIVKIGGQMITDLCGNTINRVCYIFM